MNRFLEVVKCVQNFIKLSAAVHDYQQCVDFRIFSLNA